MKNKENHIDLDLLIKRCGLKPEELKGIKEIGASTVTKLLSCAIKFEDNIIYEEKTSLGWLYVGEAYDYRYRKGDLHFFIIQRANPHNMFKVDL